MIRFRTPSLIFLAAIGALAFASTLRADKIDDEFLDRRGKLAANDVAGQYQLAEWCRSQQRWQLCADQCNEVLRLDPNNTKARLLRDIARAQLEKVMIKGRDAGVGQPGGPVAPKGKLPRLVTDQEVQRIRRAELDYDGSERVRVHVDRRLLNDFYQDMAATGTFPYDKADFFRMTPVERVGIMRKYGGPEYADKFRVLTDPERLKIFDREITGIIGDRCATADCHGGGGAGRLQIYGGRRLRTNTLYTNFLVLHEHKVGNERVIDRNTPEKSLLLTYGLPRQAAPELNHPTAIEPIFTGTSDPQYRRVLDWLQSLDLDTPDYGIDLTLSPKP